MKDATNGETLREGVSNLRSVDIRMRKLTYLKNKYYLLIVDKGNLEN